MIFKKSGSILCEGNRLAQYQFIQKYQQTFGVRWLLRRMNICPNAYYNYLKNKKHAYRQEKAEIQRKIVEIYHRENGVLDTE